MLLQYRPVERDLWLKSGMQAIAIWFANDQTGSWELCPTYFVHHSGGNGVVGRLACLARGSGYYVLTQGISASPPSPQAVCSAKAAPAAASIPTALKVRAFVDGRSQLIISGNMLHWRQRSGFRRPWTPL